MLVFFFICVGMVFYAYLGYPAVLWFISIFFEKNRRERSDNLPSVSLIISVYNEEEIIEEKIHNTLAIDYPSELFEIYVVSDGSTDRTDELVNKYRSKGILLQHYEGRIGKSACLNLAVPKCSGEIVVFSDANSMYDTHAIKELVRGFTSNDIGLVTGRTQYLVEQDDGVTDSTGLYTRLEVLTKYFESRIGSCIGADGAIFALRKALFTPLASYDINDFVIPLTVIEKGYRVVLARQAFCTEKTAEGAKGEFNRQVRITGRTLRAIFNHRQLLNPLRFPMVSFELVSHKLIKFLTPFFLGAILLASFFLMWDSMIFKALFLVQVLMYTFIWMQHHFGISVPSRLLGWLSSFVMVNVAYCVGWVKYFSGETFSTWEPERQQE